MENYEVVKDMYVVTLENGKVVKILKSFLEKNYMEGLGLDEEDAILTWLEDEEYLVNDEQEELDAVAKENKVKLTDKACDKPRKKREVVKKENPTKKAIIDKLASVLPEIDCVDVVIENETKLITFKLDGKEFKLDLVERRAKKGDK